MSKIGIYANTQSVAFGKYNVPDWQAEFAQKDGTRSQLAATSTQLKYAYYNGSSWSTPWQLVPKAVHGDARNIAHSTSDFDQTAAASLLEWIYDNGFVSSQSVRYASGLFSTGGTHGFIGYIYDNKRHGSVLMFSYGALRFWRLAEGSYYYKDLI